MVQSAAPRAHRETRGVRIRVMPRTPLGGGTPPGLGRDGPGAHMPSLFGGVLQAAVRCCPRRAVAAYTRRHRVRVSDRSDLPRGPIYNGLIGWSAGGGDGG